jgi:hypothetical protein
LASKWLGQGLPGEKGLTVSSVRGIKPSSWIYLAMVLAVAALGAAQAPQQTPAEQSQKKPVKASDKPSSKKPSLAGAARVSTNAALEDAAKQAAKKPDGAKEDPSGEAVVELRPAEAEAATSTSVKPESQKSKKAKDVHGTVFGATDAKKAGSRRTGGAAGATSKSGKTSVYVETEGDRTTPPH